MITGPQSGSLMAVVFATIEEMARKDNTVLDRIESGKDYFKDNFFKNGEDINDSLNRALTDIYSRVKE